MLLFAATACDAGADESTGTTAPATAAETTEVGTRAPSTEPPATDAPSGSSATPSGDTTAPASSVAPAPTNAPVVVPEALQFTAPLVGGGTFDGAAAAGKPTVFWFWAPT